MKWKNEVRMLKNLCRFCFILALANMLVARFLTHDQIVFISSIGTMVTSTGFFIMFIPKEDEDED